MARMNSSIPALGYKQDHVARASGVLQLADQIQARRQQAEMQRMMQQYGPALMGNDPNQKQQAMGALAQAGLGQQALQFQQKQAEIAKAQAEAQAKQQGAQAKMMGFLGAAAMNTETPEEWEQAKQLAAAQGIPQQMLDRLPYERKGMILDGIRGVEGLKEDEKSMRDFMEGKRRFELTFGETKRMNDARIATGQVGTGANVTVNMPLGRKGVNEAQGNIIGGEIQNASFENVRSLYKPEYTNMPKKLWNQVRNFGEKWGVNDLLGLGMTKEEIEFTQGFQAFKIATQGAFNAYRKEITGAAAAMSELALLEDAFINMRLSQHQFPAALDALERNTNIAMQVNNRLLREGIEPGTPQYERDFMTAFNAEKVDMTKFLTSGEDAEDKGGASQGSEEQGMRGGGGGGRMQGQVQTQRSQADAESRWQEILSAAGGDEDKALDQAEREGLF